MCIMWVSYGRMWKICEAGFGAFDVFDIEYELYIQFAFLFKNGDVQDRLPAGRLSIFKLTMNVIFHPTNTE